MIKIEFLKTKFLMIKIDYFTVENERKLYEKRHFVTKK